MHEERPNPSWFPLWIQPCIVPDLALRIAAIFRTPPAPSAARNHVSGGLHHEIGPVANQLEVHRKNDTQGGLNLGRGIYGSVESSNRDRDQPFERGNIRQNRRPQVEIGVHRWRGLEGQIPNSGGH